MYVSWEQVKYLNIHTSVETLIETTGFENVLTNFLRLLEEINVCWIISTLKFYNYFHTFEKNLYS